MGLKRLPKGVTVRCREGRGWSMRYRSSDGRMCERKLTATSRRQAHSEVLRLDEQGDIAAGKAASEADPLGTLDAARRIRERGSAAGGRRDLDGHLAERIERGLAPGLADETRAELLTPEGWAAVQAFADRAASSALEDRAPRLDVDLAEASERFRSSLATTGKTAGTIASYVLTLRHLSDALAGGEAGQLRQLSPSGLRELAGGVQRLALDLGWSPATLGRVHREAKRFLRWCRRQGMLPTDVSDSEIGDAFEAVKQRPASPAPLRPGQATRQLLEATRRRDVEVGKRGGELFPAVVGLLMTGARRDELRLMTWGELSPDCRIWDLPGRTKTHEPRSIDLGLSPGLVLMLQRMRLASGGRPDAYVFLGARRGRPWSGTGLSKAIRQVVDRFGGPEVTAQKMRQTQASAVINWPRVGPAAAAGRLGHSPPTAWRHYVKPASAAYEAEDLDELFDVRDLLGVGAQPSNTESG